MYEKFEALLVKNKITPYKVSKETGIATATLSDWKNGRSKPKTEKLLILAKYFNVDITYFLGVTTNDTRDQVQKTGR